MSRGNFPAACKAALTILATTATLLMASGAQATLVGVTIGGQLGGLGSIVVGDAFASPAKVDAGPVPEFVGTVEDADTVADVLDVEVDIFSGSFVIDTHVPGQWGTVGGDGFSVLLTDLA